MCAFNNNRDLSILSATSWPITGDKLVYACVGDPTRSWGLVPYRSFGKEASDFWRVRRPSLCVVCNRWWIGQFRGGRALLASSKELRNQLRCGGSPLSGCSDLAGYECGADLYPSPLVLLRSF